jgi:hypothetical protein
MSPAMDTKLVKKAKLDQTICWWATIIFYQFFGLIFGYLTKIMGPPIPGADLSQPGIIAFTLGNAIHMQIGLVLLAIALGFSALGTGLVVVQMKRMSGAGPVLAYGYLACGAVAALPGCLLCGLLFAVASFRPDRDPHIIAMLYDAGFIGFVGCLGCFITQDVFFAIAVFLDKRGIFPKWLGYITIWGLVTELVAVPAWIFKTGPYAWNGIIGFYLGTIIFVVWLISLITCLKKALTKQPIEEINPAYLRYLQAGGAHG